MTPLGERTAAVLAWLAGHGPATASEIGRACRIVPASVRARLVALERKGFVSSRPNDLVRYQRVYRVTDDGRRAAGIVDAKPEGAQAPSRAFTAVHH